MNRPTADLDYDTAAHEALDAGNDALYAGRRNNQRSGLLARLRARKLTARKTLLYVLAAALLISAQPAPSTFSLGCLIVVLGLMLRIWSFGHLEKNQEMITSGPFAYTRNPAYLGSSLVFSGLVLAAGNALTPVGIAIWACGAVGIGLFFTLYLPRKYRKEYSRLAQLFPGEYQRHAHHVPDFVPRLTPWQSGSERRFSWALVLLNHELVWPLACLVALGMMWIQ